MAIDEDHSKAFGYDLDLRYAIRKTQNHTLQKTFITKRITNQQTYESCHTTTIETVNLNAYCHFDNLSRTALL